MSLDLQVPGDPDIAEDFKDQLLKVYGTFIKAWRQCLDEDSSNKACSSFLLWKDSLIRAFQIVGLQDFRRKWVSHDLADYEVTRSGLGSIWCRDEQA